MDELKPGSVIQITDQSHSWYPCLLLVGEVRSWGVLATALIPTSNDGSTIPAEAPTRLAAGSYEVVGQARVSLADYWEGTR